MQDKSKAVPTELPSAAMVKEVNRSWTLISNDLEGHGVTLFRNIFELAPEALQLFSFSDEPNLYESPGLKKHAAKVMATVGVAVAGLADVPKLIPLLKSLGKRHEEYGVVPAHFDIGGAALLRTLDTALGDDFTEDIHSAWAAVYSLVAKTMIEGAGYV